MKNRTYKKSRRLLLLHVLTQMKIINRSIDAYSWYYDEMPDDIGRICRVIDNALDEVECIQKIYKIR